jgi:hypothetical protein
MYNKTGLSFYRPENSSCHALAGVLLDGATTFGVALERRNLFIQTYIIPHRKLNASSLEISVNCF